MHIPRFEIRLRPGPWSSFLLCLLILTVPLTWLAAWLVSVTVHELGHLLMTRILGISVYGVSVGLSGARIETEPMVPWQALLCSAAGPLAGALLISLRHYLPLPALFAYFHTLWNLIPFGAHDGARILTALWEMVRKIPCKPGQERIQ